jgi:hypothetical protein
MNDIKATWNHILTVWWSYTWRCLLLTIIVNFIAYFVEGFIEGQESSTSIIVNILWVLLFTSLQIYIFKVIFNTQFNGFSIAIVSTKEAMNEIKVTWNHILTVWWGYTWRYILLSISVGLIVSFIDLFVEASELVDSFVVGFLESPGQEVLEIIVMDILFELKTAPIAIYIFKVILNKKFNGYSIAIISDEDKNIVRL